MRSGKHSTSRLGTHHRSDAEAQIQDDFKNFIVIPNLSEKELSLWY